MDPGSRAQTTAVCVQAQVEEARAELEREKGLRANLATPQGTEHISIFRGRRDCVPISRSLSEVRVTSMHP